MKNIFNIKRNSKWIKDWDIETETRFRLILIGFGILFFILWITGWGNIKLIPP